MTGIALAQSNPAPENPPHSLLGTSSGLSGGRLHLL